MKSYLLIPLFFLNMLCSPIFLFSQENMTEQHLPTTENPSVENSYLKDLKNDELENYPDYSETPRTEPIERESDSFQRKFFNMLFILGLLIGFMILASWALKRMMKAKITNLNTSNTIKVLETRYLSPRATLYLIEIQNKNFLIAESPTNVTYLASIPSLGEAEETSASPSVRPRPFFNES